MDPRTPLFMYRLQHSPAKADRLIRERLGAAAPAKIGPRNRASLLDRVFGTSRYVTPAALQRVGKERVGGKKLRAPAIEEIAIMAPESLGRAAPAALRVMPIEEVLAERVPKVISSRSELEAVRGAIVDAMPKGDRARREMSSKSRSHLHKAIALMDDKIVALGGRRTKFNEKLGAALGNLPHDPRETKEDIKDALEFIKETGMRGSLKNVVAELNAAFAALK